MNYSVSPETLTVLQNFHERVKNRLLRLREQQEWESYCVQHNIAENPRHRRRATSVPAGPSATSHRGAADATPRKPPTRKVSSSSPAYSLRRLSDQLGIYYRELERLQNNSGSAVSLRSPKAPASGEEKFVTVSAQTQTVSVVVSSERVSQSREATVLDGTRERFRIRLNSDPNERFSVVRKERVFKGLDGSRPHVTWASSNATRETEEHQASCGVDVNKHKVQETKVTLEKTCSKRPTLLLRVPAGLSAELESYRKQVEGQTTWKPLLSDNVVGDPWTAIDSITKDIFRDIVSGVFEEVECVFSGVIDELLDQELADQTSSQ